MVRKAISPLVAIVIIVAVTLAIGVFVAIWLSGIARVQTETTVTFTRPECQFVFLYSASEQLTDSSLYFTIENRGTANVTINDIRIAYADGTTTFASKEPIGLPLLLLPGDRTPFTIRNTTAGTIQKDIRYVLVMTDCPNANLEISGEKIISPYETVTFSFSDPLENDTYVDPEETENVTITSAQLTSGFNTGILTSIIVAASDHPIISVTPSWTAILNDQTLTIEISANNGNTWHAASNGVPVDTSGDDNNHYLRWRALFSTTTPGVGAVLESISLDFDVSKPRGVTISPPEPQPPEEFEAVCGNDVCELGEDYTNCPEDCPPPPMFFDSFDNTNFVDLLESENVTVSTILGLAELNTFAAEVWAKIYGISFGWDDLAYGVAVDSSDYVIVTGYGYNSSKANTDWLTVKYDPAGNIAWTKVYDRPGYHDYAYDVAVDSQDNIFVTGEVTISMTDYLTIKYDPDGNELWNKSFDIGESESARAVVVDSQDNVIVTGFLSALGYIIFTVKYNGTNGDELWNVSFNRSSGVDRSEDIAIDSEDNIIVVGYLYNSTAGNYDFLIIKYNGTNGDELWNTTFDGGGDETASGVAIDSQDNIIVVGSGYYRKYDSNGNLLLSWTEYYATAVTTDPQDNIITAAQVYNGATYNYAVVKYDSSGNKLWVEIYDSGYDDHAYDVAIDSQNNVIVTGFLYNTTAGGRDYLTIKYSESYYAAGSLYSAAFDAGAPVSSWGDIEWNASVSPGITSLAFQTRSATVDPITNIALNQTANASSYCDPGCGLGIELPPSDVVDGVLEFILGDPDPSIWLSNFTAYPTPPHWLAVNFSQLKNVSRTKFYTPCFFDPEDCFINNNYTIETWNGASWETQVTVVDNTEAIREDLFPSMVETQAVRIYITGVTPASDCGQGPGSCSPAAAITEFEIYSGDWSSWSSAYTTSGVSITSPTARYLQYRANFGTTNPALTPKLYDISLSYTP